MFQEGEKAIRETPWVWGRSCQTQPRLLQLVLCSGKDGCCEAQKPQYVAVSLRARSTVTANHKPETVVGPSLSTTLMEENVWGCVRVDENDEWQRKRKEKTLFSSSSLLFTSPHPTHLLKVLPSSPLLQPHSLLHNSQHGGGRIGWGWGRVREAQWLTMQHAPVRRTQLNHWNHLNPPSSSQPSRNFTLFLQLIFSE